jgi:hypothetical protein
MTVGWRLSQLSETHTYSPTPLVPGGASLSRELSSLLAQECPLHITAIDNQICQFASRSTDFQVQTLALQWRL